MNIIGNGLQSKMAADASIISDTIIRLKYVKRNSAYLALPVIKRKEQLALTTSEAVPRAVRFSKSLELFQVDAAALRRELLMT